MKSTLKDHSLMTASNDELLEALIYHRVKEMYDADVRTILLVDPFLIGHIKTTKEAVTALVLNFKRAWEFVPKAWLEEYRKWKKEIEPSVSIKHGGKGGK